MKDCEKCHAADVIIVLNGLEWICWDCYCEIMKESRQISELKEKGDL